LRHLAVVTPHGHLVGILTRQSFLQNLHTQVRSAAGQIVNIVNHAFAGQLAYVYLRSEVFGLDVRH
jgi:predicted transcriptional regulator